MATFKVIGVRGFNPVLQLTWFPYKGTELNIDSVEEMGDGGWRVVSREGNYTFRPLSDRDKKQLQAEIDALTGASS